jgi:hypothetical protein
MPLNTFSSLASFTLHLTVLGSLLAHSFCTVDWERLGAEIRPGSESRAKAPKGSLELEIRLASDEQSGPGGETGIQRPGATGGIPRPGASERTRKKGSTTKYANLLASEDPPLTSHH